MYKHLEKRFLQKCHFSSAYFSAFSTRFSRNLTRDPKSLKTRFLNFLVNSYAKREYEREMGFSPFNGSENFSSVLEEFQKALPSVDIVSFDVFDTLLVRKVKSPADVFKLIEADTPDNSGFCDERLAAERRALNLIGRPVSLNEIYSVILPKFRHLKAKELCLEKKILSVNPKVYPLYQMALKAGKKVIATSDMYLPDDFIKEQLIACGYTHLTDVFVSGSLGLTKAKDGKLFTYAATKLGVPPQKILHIGDSRHADKKLAEASGLKAIQVPKLMACADASIRRCYASSNTLGAATHNGLLSCYQPSGSYLEDFGYCLGGPLAVSYLLWLSHESRLSNIGNLLFVARDGWILKNIYDAYLKNEGQKTGYIYLNRMVCLKAFPDCEYARPLSIYLAEAHQEIKTPPPGKDHAENVRIFNQNKEALLAWSAKAKEELANHLLNELAGAQTAAIVDLTTKHFTPLKAAKTLIGDKLQDAFFLVTYDDRGKDLIYQSFAGSARQTSSFTARCPLGPNGFVSLSETIEVLISSPESLVRGLYQGKPVYDKGADDHAYYPEIARGITRYAKDFLETFGEDPTAALTFDEWIGIAQSFFDRFTKEDAKALSGIAFSGDIDNMTNVHSPFSKKK